MSIDLNWEALTAGPDGQELAHRIRDFIHDKFQTVPLPRFIKSVTVHDFDFGSIAPELELKDITDPLPDFYEEDDEDGEGEDEESDEDGGGGAYAVDGEATADDRRLRDTTRRRHAYHRQGLSGSSYHTVTGLGVGGGATPVRPAAPAGVPGGTANLLHHFHSHLTPAGWSGTQTPLAAMAGAHLSGSGGGSMPAGLYQDYFYSAAAAAAAAASASHGQSHSRQPSHSSSISASDYRDGLRAAAAGDPSLLHPGLREKHSVSTLAASGGASRPPTREGTREGTKASAAGATMAQQLLAGSAIEDDNSSDGGSGRRGDDDDGDNDMDRTLLLGQAMAGSGPRGGAGRQRLREPRAEDMQAVFWIRYAGDVKLLLIADILLDYPMPSFVGIPVRLSITGLTFDGVGVLAKIRKRVHFCFLSPEDALAAVGDEGGEGDDEDEDEGGGEDTMPNTPATPARGMNTAPTTPRTSRAKTKIGGLLQEVRVESEIGQRESGKQSLKNVGKVERFVLEQVRRIFEEEFVYPSFWTFLV